MFGWENVNARDGFFSPRAIAPACFTDLINSSKDFLSIAKLLGNNIAQCFQQSSPDGVRT